MRMSIIAALSGLLMGAVVERANGETPPKFTKSSPVDAVHFVSHTSQDGQARTMLFDNFIISTDVAQPSEPDVSIKTFTYVYGVESEEDVCVHQDFRGYLSRQDASSVTLIVHAGGKTTVVDLEKAMADANSNVIDRDDPTNKAAAAAAAAAGFEESKPDADSSDYYARVSTAVPKGQPLQTTVILLVDRVRAGGDPQAMITIDTIESEVIPERKAAQ